jgi:dynein light intermediate chain 1, cytosolic
LAKNYDENAKKPDRDPRGAFKNPIENATAGIVGPMGTSSFSLPHVERALTEMEGSAASNVLAASVSGNDPNRKLSRSTRTVASLANGGGQSGSQSNLSRSTGPSSPPTGSPSPTGGQTQHEVLQNFFQSLLSSKDRTSGAAAMKTAGNTPKTNGTTSPGQGGDTSTSSS